MLHRQYGLAGIVPEKFEPDAATAAAPAALRAAAPAAVRTAAPAALRAAPPVIVPAPRLSVDAVVTDSVYLATPSDQLFAMTHLPSSLSSGSTGVVFCPPFGWPEICTYRVRRKWADAVARAGHPAVRVDLPGTGESSGTSRDPNLLAAWTAAITTAAWWLRDEVGCSRVVAIGIELGGMLAWLAAGEGAPIDDLVLWGARTQGRRWLREVRVAARIDIDAEFVPELLPTPASPPAPPPADELLDQAGQVISTETIAALEQVDLTKRELPDIARRRILLFERDQDAGDGRLHAFLAASGADLTVADGDNYGAMIQYVQQSQVPTDAIERSVAWLAQSVNPAGEPCVTADRQSPGHVHTVPALELRQDGATLRETQMTIEAESVLVRCTVTEPAEPATAGVCAVFLNGGSDRRIGPNRMWVETARRWAARGVPAVRIDPPGIGDSDGDERYFDDPKGHYGPRHVTSMQEILDAIEERVGCRRFVLVGLCSGATRSFQVAAVDARVAGVFAVALPWFSFNWWGAYVRNWWVADRRPKPTDTLRTTVLVWILQHGWRVAQSARELSVRYLRRRPDQTDIALARLRSQGTELLLLFRSRSKTREEMVGEGRLARMLEMPNVRVKRIPGNDVRFRPLELQQFVNDELDDALTRVLERERSPATAHLDLDLDLDLPPGSRSSS